MAKANDIQHGGDHYKTKRIEPWDYVAANGLGFFEGNAIKYLTRWRDKDGIRDLRKAMHYIEKLIELETKQPDDAGTGLELQMLPQPKIILSDRGQRD